MRLAGEESDSAIIHGQIVEVTVYAVAVCMALC